MLLEVLEGDIVSIHDLAVCEDRLDRLHRLGTCIIYGDVDRYNFILYWPKKRVQRNDLEYI